VARQDDDEKKFSYPCEIEDNLWRNIREKVAKAHKTEVHNEKQNYTINMRSFLIID
jgi:hypothetical protein